MTLDLFAQAEAIKRRRGQARKILDRLSQGTATASELAALALSYRQRISELRAEGFEIVCVENDPETGVSVYSLDGYVPIGT